MLRILPCTLLLACAGVALAQEPAPAEQAKGAEKAAVDLSHVRVGQVYVYESVVLVGDSKIVSGLEYRVLEVKEGTVRYRQSTVAEGGAKTPVAEAWWGRPPAATPEGGQATPAAPPPLEVRKETLEVVGRRWECQVSRVEAQGTQSTVWAPTSKGLPTWPPLVRATTQSAETDGVRTELWLVRIEPPAPDLSHVKPGQCYVYRSLTVMGGNQIESVMKYRVLEVAARKVRYEIVIVASGQELSGVETSWELPAVEPEAPTTGGARGPAARPAPADAPQVKSQPDTLKIGGKEWPCLRYDVEGSGLKTSSWVPQRDGLPTWPPFLHATSANSAQGMSTSVTLESIEEPAKR